ncbi:hypothetical protein ACH61_00694 [Rathayibacter tanaceti]|uniref:Uncharacterized protein n=1 Tax=Rathayibacter tanaceti TaxID=1671680 RepID=A0A166D7L6_9MICO|nr:hypothetical protein ACH61_00694 [Rathayibacter tanaceti]
MPSKSARPPPRTATRVAGSGTSANRCVLSSTVLERERSATTSRKKLCCSGSSPTEGSSRIQNAGSWTREAAMPTRCRIPPESDPNRLPAESARRTSPRASRARRRRSRCGRPLSQPQYSTHSCAVKDSGNPTACARKPTSATPRAVPGNPRRAPEHRSRWSRTTEAAPRRAPPAGCSCRRRCARVRRSGRDRSSAKAPGARRASRGRGARRRARCCASGRPRSAVAEHDAVGVPRCDDRAAAPVHVPGREVCGVATAVALLVAREDVRAVLGVGRREDERVR